MDYPASPPEQLPAVHAITSEILTRLQELDELSQGDESLPPAGIRLVNKLAAVERRNRRAYRLILDMVGDQKSFSHSLEALGASHVNSSGDPTSRQSWLQNAQSDVDLICEVWSEVGVVMRELLKRRQVDHQID